MVLKEIQLELGSNLKDSTTAGRTIYYSLSTGEPNLHQK